MEYYERLKLIRTGKDITQEEIGKHLGISKQQYNKYEKGIHLMPIPYLIAACQYLHVSADYILGLGKHMTFPPFE